MPSGKKWSHAYANGNQAFNVSKSADLCTFNEGQITDLRVSTIEGKHYSEGAANVKGTTYGSSDFAGLTISAETIRYEGGGKLSNYIDTGNGTDIEQYIQPLVFFNNFEDGKGAARGVVSHALQKDASVANDPNLKISAFGMFGAPGENLVLTVADAGGGIFNYIEGKATGQLATGKTAITVDASNRVFMGVNGQDLRPGGLSYLVKGSPNAQLYVKGDIVVDGSGVQIEKYLVDDIFVGSSAAIMGNGLADASYNFTNDIGVSVPNLATVLENTEHQTLSGGYLFVANNSSFFGNVGISGGATLGDGLTLDNSGYWIDGAYSTLNITTPIHGQRGSVNGISYKSIDSNMYDYGYDSRELISTFQHAIYDGSDSALLLHHSSPNTSQGSLIFLRTRGTSGETLDTDVTGEIQFRGMNVDGSQNGTGYLKSTGAGNINLYAPNDITIDGSSSVILKTNTTNNITYSQVNTSDTAAVAIINPGTVTADDYDQLLNTQDMAIPTVHYVKSIDYWKPYNPTGGGHFDTITLNNVQYPDVSNINIPGTIVCPNLKVPEHFKTVCKTSISTDHWWIFPTGISVSETCTKEPVPGPGPPSAITDFSSTVFFEAPVTMRYGSTRDLSLTDAALYIAPLNADESASMSLISSRTAESYDEQNATVYFGTKWGTGNTQVIHNIGAIQGEIETGQSVGNMLFYGSDANQNLKSFMEYHGGSSPYTEINRVDGSQPVLMINDFTPISSNSFTGSTTFSSAKLSLQRQNGQDPSSNPIGIIGEIDFNGYANGNGLGSSLTTAVSLQCWNAGDSQAQAASQGQNGFFSINVFDNGGVNGGLTRSALEIDTHNHIFINAAIPTLKYDNNGSTYIQDIWEDHMNGGFIFPGSSPPPTPGFSVWKSGTDSDKSNINSGIIAAAGGYITGTYIPDNAADYYMADVSYVNNHVSENGSNWEVKNETYNNRSGGIDYLQPKSDVSSNVGVGVPILANWRPTNNTELTWSKNVRGLTVQPEASNTADAALAVVSNRNRSVSGHANAVIYLGNYNDGKYGSQSHPLGASGEYLLGGIRGYYPNQSGLNNIGNVQLFGSQDGTNNKVFLDYNGKTNDLTVTANQVQFNTTVVQAPSFNATSDVAKKENIQTISGALESIDELRGVTYNLKADEGKKTHHGVVAQEIEKIFPNMVSGEEGNKSVAYMEIIGVLVEAVKDLKKRVEELENK